MADLSVQYLGLRLASPIVVGASGLTKSVQAIEQCAAAGAGAVVLKSIFEEQILADVEELVEQGADTLWHPEAGEYIRAYGREGAVTAFLDLIRDAKRVAKLPVIASVHCVSPGAWNEFAGRLEKAGADALELNVNVLGTDPRLTSAQMEDLYFRIAQAVKRSTNIPVSIKLGPHFSSMTQFMTQLSNSGLAGLTLFNRAYASDFDIEGLQLTPARFLSSPEEYVTTLRWISLLSGRCGCDLSAATGVHDGKTVIKMLLAGAASVQVVSTLYDKGVPHIGAMLEELRAWMERHGHNNIRDFRGKMSQSMSENPAAYERIQFMRHSVGIE